MVTSFRVARFVAGLGPRSPQCRRKCAEWLSRNALVRNAIMRHWTDGNWRVSKFSLDGWLYITPLLHSMILASPAQIGKICVHAWRTCRYS